LRGELHSGSFPNHQHSATCRFWLRFSYDIGLISSIRHPEDLWSRKYSRIGFEGVNTFRSDQELSSLSTPTYLMPHTFNLNPNAPHNSKDSLPCKMESSGNPTDYAIHRQESDQRFIAGSLLWPSISVEDGLVTLPPSPSVDLVEPCELPLADDEKYGEGAGESEALTANRQTTLKPLLNPMGDYLNGGYLEESDMKDCSQHYIISSDPPPGGLMLGIADSSEIAMAIAPCDALEASISALQSSLPSLHSFSQLHNIALTPCSSALGLMSSIGGMQSSLTSWTGGAMPLGQQICIMCNQVASHIYHNTATAYRCSSPDCGYIFCCDAQVLRAGRVPLAPVAPDGSQELKLICARCFERINSEKSASFANVGLCQVPSSNGSFW